MKKIVILFSVVLVTYFIVGCGGFAGGLQEPTPDGMLIVGSCIVENNGNDDRFETMYEYIEVALLGLNTVDGETKFREYWAETDKDGYFFKCNAPRGKYNLQGIKVWIAGASQKIISSQLEGPNPAYKLHRATDPLQIVFKGEYFPPEPVGRVYNLNHHTFIVHSNWEVTHDEYLSMNDQKLVIGTTYTRPNVIEYFSVKFSETGWKPILEEPYRTKSQK